MEAVMEKSIRLATGIASIFLLQACSGHPGAGHWESNLSLQVSQYTALELEFDGKGTLHPNKSIVGQEEKADLWCLWQATSATTLDVQCGDGSAEKTNIKFEFVVVVSKEECSSDNTFNKASLNQEGNIVAMFSRKP
jgi:hypothetical protein